MINLTKGQTQTIIFTGTEQALLTSPFFLFICKCRGTNSEVAFVVENESEYTSRYDKATVIVNDHFENEDCGLWEYEIYEQASSTNVDPTGLNKVEEGFINLHPATEFEPTVYESQTNTVTTYGD
jgi:hypothetical protein